MARPEQSPSLPGYLQENETSEEFRDLIGSIPTEKGWVANHLHQYQGFWHTSRQLQGVLACQKHFQAQDGRLPIGVEHHAFFRRGEVGDSKNHLTAEMKEKMDMITEQKLHCYGLKL
ncbi:hypothetical protein OIU77_001172 [Salix suchowensis]|uniref:Sulfotransferase n=1 Tax=Salix suchowensis TaxID=1278906 RepID=A0ABQ8ZGG8_9ROSI|nr:hypothetical protein OIU77_001172 [Salix suchowensis]